jgi:outer membrane protein assembly factor BamB
MHHWPDWPQYPHVHGSPVFARFADGSGRMYVWPEKDHLKSFPWTGAGFNLQAKMLGVDRNGKLVVGPDGMPGGMLAVAVDTLAARSGVVFASQTQNAATDGPGLLRAFDAITLKEIWNNSGDSYQFSKFTPPMIANGRVYLATCSNKVLVYGPN